jgi:hypothetical protein
MEKLKNQVSAVRFQENLFVATYGSLDLARDWLGVIKHFLRPETWHLT